MLLICAVLFGAAGCTGMKSKIAATRMNKQINFPYGTWDAYKISALDSPNLAARLNDTISLSDPVARTTAEGSYFMFTQEDQTRVFIRFSQSKNYIIDVWGMGKTLSYDDFSSLTVGKSTSEDVFSIDSYMTLLVPSAESETPYSHHRLKDGTLLVITYEKKGSSFLLQEMRKEEEPSGFFSVILPEDLPA